MRIIFEVMQRSSTPLTIMAIGSPQVRKMVIGMENVDRYQLEFKHFLVIFVRIKKLVVWIQNKYNYCYVHTTSLTLKSDKINNKMLKLESITIDIFHPNYHLSNLWRANSHDDSQGRAASLTTSNIILMQSNLIRRDFNRL